jgi:hypothetical protein
MGWRNFSKTAEKSSSHVQRVFVFTLCFSRGRQILQLMTMSVSMFSTDVLGLLANLKQHAKLSEACLVEATGDNNLSVERNSMSN